MPDNYKHNAEKISNGIVHNDDNKPNKKSSKCSNDWCKTRYGRLTTTVVVFVAGCLIVIFLFHEFLSSLLSWMEVLPAWQGSLIFLLLVTAVSFPMTWGLIVLNLAAGFIYGWLLGFLIIFISSVFGVIISVVICRRFCKNYFRRKMVTDGGYIRALISLVEGPKGYRVIALSRLTPMPYGFQNGLFAITDAGITRIALATMTGNLPLILINAYIGSKLRSMEDVTDSNRIDNYAIVGIQILVSIGLMIYVVRRSRLELKKALHDVNDTQGSERTIGARLLSHTDPVYIESQQLDDKDRKSESSSTTSSDNNKNNYNRTFSKDS